MEYQYKIGADPELFLRDASGSFKSAHNVIPGNKRDPMPVLNGAIQPDGLAAEFNINPASSSKEFSNNIRDVLQELSQRVSEKGLSLFVTPTARFDAKYFKRLPKAAKAMGCDPDYNVYSGVANPPPATTEPMRTGGGHIHVGWTEGQKVSDQAHVYDCEIAVKQLDTILYPMSLLWDSDNDRRTLYGKIGTYRPKHYGVEYRPLSNMWVSDPDLHRWIFEATRHSMESVDAGFEFYSDPVCIDMVNQIRADKPVTRAQLLEYHGFITEEYLVPELPEAYVRAVN